MPKWIEVAFAVEPERSEALVAELMELGAAGAEERDQTTFQKSAHAGKAVVVVWIPVDEARDFLERARAAGLPPPTDDERVRDEEEWRDAWKKYFAPRKVGRFVIVPGWETYAPQPDEIVIDMDPGRAFGTGGHPSTRLCLEAISALPHVDRFLDVGCGSGVLGIACALAFAAATGIGVDVDADADEVSRENAARNRVGARISYSATPVDEVHGPFDVVLANILPDVLVPLAPVIAARVGAGGILVLSGILRGLADDVEAAYVARGLSTRERRDEDGWRALVMTR